jgi:hypothetical protein
MIFNSHGHHSISKFALLRYITHRLRRSNITLERKDNNGMLRRRTVRKPNQSGAAPNIFILVVVCGASFFAGTLFSLQASIGVGGQQQCASEAEIHAIVASRVTEGAWLQFGSLS